MKLQRGYSKSVINSISNKKPHIIGIIIFLLLSSCSGDRQESDTESRKLNVVATTGMLYDAVLQVGDTLVDASPIMGPGVDPHLYKATQGDLKKLRNADLIIYNGLLLEGKMGDILDNLGRRKPVFAAGKVINKERLLSSRQYENAYDPHIWFDVSLWKEAVRGISLKLQELDSVNSKLYQERTTNYLSTLDTLDRYVRSKIATIPAKQRVLVTAHDAFGYFGKAYDIEVQGLQGISTVSDFGLKDIANLTDLIIERNVKAIFVETSVSDKAIKAVINGCREKGHEVTVGGSLYSDAMGEFGTYEGTYVGMVNHNVDIITNSLK